MIVEMAKYRKLRAVLRTRWWSAWDRITGTSEGVFRVQFVWWGLPASLWDFGLRPWSHTYRTVGLRNSLCLGPLELRLWRIPLGQWERIMETWRAF